MGYCEKTELKEEKNNLIRANIGIFSKPSQYYVRLREIDHRIKELDDQKKPTP